MKVNNMYQITRSEVEHVLATLDMMEAGLDPDATLHEEHLAEARELLHALVQGGTNGEEAGEQPVAEAPVEAEESAADAPVAEDEEA